MNSSKLRVSGSKNSDENNKVTSSQLKRKNIILKHQVNNLKDSQGGIDEG